MNFRILALILMLVPCMSDAAVRAGGSARVGMSRAGGAALRSSTGSKGDKVSSGTNTSAQNKKVAEDDADDKVKEEIEDVAEVEDVEEEVAEEVHRSALRRHHLR